MRIPFHCRKKMLATAVASASFAAFHSGAALAQLEITELEEVVVTASAREQSVQDIPYNISAMQGSDIEDRKHAGF